MKATKFTVKRVGFPPFCSWAVYFNGEYVGIPENDNDYHDAVALGRKFVKDYNAGNVDERYLKGATK